MPRRKLRIKKLVNPDPVHSSVLVEKVINRSMKDGKKSVASAQVYEALKIVSAKTGEDGVKMLEKALDNIKPVMEVRPRRIGGAAYQVPMQVRGTRKESLGVRWLITSARLRSNSEFHTYAEKLAAEIVDASGGEGAAVKKRLDMERVAEANRAFAHFNW
ncbi:MAG: hypothetical protein ACD_52C00116G0003 [uncultured bacterium]|nr:MAG: hypothetical protein ACD_52C00116G0003 [uncultured bacterium]